MQYHNHKDSPFDLQPLEWILKAEAGLHSLQYLVVAVLRSPKNAQFQTLFLTCLRLWRLSSKFKIHSKGFESNGEALWICQCLFFLSTYWFSYILRPFIFVIPNRNTLYNIGFIKGGVRRKLCLATNLVNEIWKPKVFDYYYRFSCIMLPLL